MSIGRKRALDELDADIREHIERETQDNVERGMTPEEARRRAMLAFGNIALVKEDTRAVWIRPWLAALRQDVGYALRMLRRNPGLSTTIILTVALGVGANSAIFSIVNAVLLRPLPYPEPDRLVSVDTLLGGEYLFLRDHARTVQQLALYRASVGFNLSDGGETERLTGSYVSANFFSTLGIAPVLGRPFLSAEEEPGRSDVIVLSHQLWRQRFGADPGIIGRAIVVDAEPRMVVGVMPSSFNFPAASTQFWVPYTFDRGDATALWTGAIGGVGVARLAPGVRAAQVQAERRGLVPELRRANTEWVFPATWGENRRVTLLQDRIVGDVRTRLLIILGAVFFVLLIACANVANLLLARASARHREVAIRNALGAGRNRILRQLLTESVVLGLLGGTAGIALAFWGVRLLGSSLPADIPRVEEIGIDRWVLAFTVVLSVVTALGFGTMPAIRSSRPNVQVSLKAEERSTTTLFGRTAGVFVVGEVALAVMLVMGAGLLIRSFAELVRVDPGFRTDSILTARITPPDTRYSGDDRTRALYTDLIARARTLPGVREVEAASHLPLVGGTRGFAFEVEGSSFVPGTGAPMTGDRRVTPGYLHTMGIPLLQGRPLADTDREHTPRVAVINEAMARQQWPGMDPIGKRFKEVWRDDWMTVVGVAGDVKHDGLASETQPEIYRPFLQMPSREMSIVVRTAGDPTALASILRETVATVDPVVPVSEIRTGDQLISGALNESRFTTLLLSAFATVALVLAAIGIYGVLSYAVTRRTREIGVRMALGARRVDVLRLVLGRALLLVGVGTIAGVGAAFAGSRLLETLLFGITSTDLITFTVVPILLACVAVIAAYIPARHAMRVDPTTALRVE